MEMQPEKMVCREIRRTSEVSYEINNSRFEP